MEQVKEEDAGENDAELEKRILAELDRRVAAEKSAREIALSAQDHRLVSSLGTLFRTILNKKADSRRERLSASLTAIAWCLVPRASTATIGFVAIASLLLAWQQARLLSSQNDKIEIQNLLSEAQRRSGLLYESTAIFAILDEEKKQAIGRSCPPSADGDLCWHVAENGSQLFIPSRATVGRIAALTQALRPYRYLSVENARPYRFIGAEDQREICPQNISSQTLAETRTLFRRAENQSPEEDARLRRSDVMKQEIAAIYQSGASLTVSGTSNFAASEGLSLLDRLMTGVIGSSATPAEIALNCAPASPERGQLLISLHAAGVDISKIYERGGDFRYADIPGAYLRGVVLKGVDLSFSRLPGAQFQDAILDKVSFESAHISGINFRGSKLSWVYFDGSIIQSFSDGAASSGPFTAAFADSNALGGIRFVETSAKDDLLERLCLAVSMVSRFDRQTSTFASTPKPLPMMRELERFALLEERRQSRPGAPLSLIAVIVPKILGTTQILHQSPNSTAPTSQLKYSVFSDCGWPGGQPVRN
ncbi:MULTISPECIES: pentapeptide repeat-containing protein [unclassified Ensifer]|uniref:pentapeptide repeat-containing protein n=1 Tax=unclassified Ensifer TaxID=2633371 RepID=UPI000812D129|nr:MULTISPECIES: pentapeptide repeat-containing protein [unclassified Ensifer]OCP05793.1 hypothetical protein BBX50_04730 [Ensifer sp. LC11]OCP06538.1 hypothetical protein BC374_04795 [Ensifer sp. LC13]OCP06736.1 hypothetical protein BC362_11370 [Ensifer sp. LC14]OCP31222.1 hypothetical protein BC364_05300 [Ensifer sp. LC499]